ncbi:CECR1.2 family protein [Megaselia abdita]
MSSVTTLLIVILLVVNESFPQSLADDLDIFRKDKELLLKYEFSMTLGYKLSLNPLEQLANEVITKAKRKEIDEGFFDPAKFGPSFHFFESLAKIQESSLYKLVKKMPKAGILHSHDSALGSTQIMIDLTYKEFCWICFHKDENVEFMFSRKQPKTTKNCDNWQLMEDYRKNGGMSDEELSKKLTLYPKSNHTDVNDVWNHFQPIFAAVGGIIGYKETFLEYIEKTFQELFDDGVQYVELRSSLYELYDLDGNYMPRSETAKVIEKVVEDFIKKNPSFIGAKVIFSKSRRTEPISVEEYLNEAVTLKSQFPNFMCGFDLVGQEDLGKPLQEFIPELLSKTDSMNYFFHAGETNWYGTTTDENLFDAVLMLPKRIGHGFALNKHPLIVDIIKHNDICIEVNPLSNQVLHLVKDLRNHPAAYFIANNIPMVVSSDDPGFWGAAPLSHDFYVTFLGIASVHADLRLLKQLAINSIQYSCMSPNEKTVAFQKWRSSWNLWIKEVASLKN